MSAAAFRSRIKRLEDPLVSAASLRMASWLESLPEEDKGAGVLLLAFDGDMDVLKRQEPDFKDSTDEEITEALNCKWVEYVRHLRAVARELRGKRR